MESGELLRAISQIAFSHNRIAPIDRFGLVPAHFYRRAARYARPLHIAYRGAPSVVNQATGYATAAARLRPRVSYIDYARAIPANKHPRNNPSRFACPLDCAMALALRFEHFAKLADKGNHAALAVLGLTRAAC